MRCIGAVLAGGQATRFAGAPKGLEQVGGVTIVARAAAALRQVSDALLVVANGRALDDAVPGARVVPDLICGAGSLGGLHSALVHAQEGAASSLLVLAWDMPFVPASLLRELREIGEREGADAFVPEGPGKHGLEPLCAWYGPGCIAAIEARLRVADRRVVSFLSDVRTHRLPLARVRAHGDPAAIFLNVNTPADLAIAEDHERRPAHAADAGDRRP